MNSTQIAQARANASTFLTASVTIDRTDGATSFDRTTGTISDGTRTTIYQGAASISTSRAATSSVQGDQHLLAGQTLVRAPISANDVQPGDRVTITAAGDWPTGATLWVHEVQGRHVAVLARLICSTNRPGDVT